VPRIHYPRLARQRDTSTVDRPVSFMGFLIAVYFLFAPLEDVLSISGNTFAKYFGALICLFAIYPILTATRRVPQIDAVVAAVTYLAALSLASVTWAPDVSAAHTAATTHVLLIGLFVVVYWIDLSGADVRLIELFAIVGGLASAVYMLASGELASIWAQRLDLTSNSDPNNLAALLALPTALAFHRLLTANARSARVLYLASFLSLVILMVGTASRGAAVGLAFFFLVYAFLSAKGGPIWRFWVQIVGLVVVIGGIALVVPAQLRERLFSISGYTVDYSAGETGTRSVIWKHIVFDVLPHLPFYGVGAGNAPNTLYQWYFYQKGVHNIYLNMCVEFGVLGIPIFLLFLGVLFFRNLQRRDFFRVAVLVLYLVIAFFLDAFIKKYFWNGLIYVSIGLGFRDDEEPEPLRHQIGSPIDFGIARR